MTQAAENIKQERGSRSLRSFMRRHRRQGIISPRQQRACIKIMRRLSKEANNEAA